MTGGNTAAFFYQAKHRIDSDSNNNNNIISSSSSRSSSSKNGRKSWKNPEKISESKQPGSIKNPGVRIKQLLGANPINPAKWISPPPPPPPPHTNKSCNLYPDGIVQIIARKLSRSLRNNNQNILKKKQQQHEIKQTKVNTKPKQLLQSRNPSGRFLTRGSFAKNPAKSLKKKKKEKSDLKKKNPK